MEAENRPVMEEKIMRLTLFSFVDPSCNLVESLFSSSSREEIVTSLF